MVQIGVLTYNVPHRKTQDILFGLKALGYNARVYIVDFIERNNFKPLYSHRPTACIQIDTTDLCDNLGFEYSQHKDYDFAMHENTILIAGARILPASIIRPGIINSHPGILPYTRGLDALKWSIYYGAPTGVTIHEVSAEVDEGKILNRAYMNPLPTDTFYHFAMRVYEKEIDMLLHWYERNEYDEPYTAGSANMRMPHDKELLMMERFKQIKWSV